MKKTTLIAVTVATLAAAPVFAGGLSEPVMEPKVVTAAMTETSSGSTYLPFILMAVLAAAALSN